MDRAGRNKGNGNDICGLAARRSRLNRVAIIEGVRIRVAVRATDLSASIEVHRLIGMRVEVDDGVRSGRINPNGTALPINRTRGHL